MPGITHVGEDNAEGGGITARDGVLVVSGVDWGAAVQGAAVTDLDARDSATAVVLNHKLDVSQVH
jgi:hypothetical protein